MSVSIKTKVMSKSISTEQMRADFRRERQIHGWEGNYLELEAAYLAGRRRNMKEVERTTESADKRSERGAKCALPVQ